MERRLLLLLVAASALAILMLLGETAKQTDLSEIYPPDCGKRPAINSEVESKIRGGQDARRGSWPWQVSVQLHSPYYGYSHTCSGVLLNYNTVLTAAHCVPHHSDPQRYKVVVGLHNLKQEDQYTQSSNVYEIIQHVNFSKKTFQDDIALMLLEKKFKFDYYTQPICLPLANQVPVEKYKCSIAGWGQKSIMGFISDILQEANVELISQQICNGVNWYAGTLQSNMICAGYEEGGVGSCLGDDGGPLMCFFPLNGKFYLMGITSFGHGCGERRAPTVYTLVPGYVKWIDLVLVSQVPMPMSAPEALYFWIIGWGTLHLVL